MEEERFVGSTLMSEDSDWDVSLRPTNLGEYVGQEKIKENLKVFIEASKKRNQALDHVLLYGPPGLGKTTLSYIISNELGSNIRITSGPAIERAADLAAILTNLSENDVLFIDEIHRLNRAVEEILYPAMEDFALDIIIGKGPSARSMRINLPQFTLIGATTRAGMLTGPLRDRFGVICRLELYTSSELASIIGRSAKILEIGITKEAELEIAKRSRGTPRIANRLLKRVRDFAEVKNKGIIDIEVARYALEKLEIDELGLDFNDINLLKIMISRFGGGPVGAETLASALNEETVTIEDVIEPYLLQTGFIARTPRGRICLPFAYRHLGLKMPVEKEKQLGFFDSGQMVNTPQLAAESAADDGSRACSGVDIDHFDNGECDG